MLIWPGQQKKGDKNMKKKYLEQIKKAADQQSVYKQISDQKTLVFSLIKEVSKVTKIEYEGELVFF
jgi:hypothetical protein